MAKRGATCDINHDNWDQPFEAEEAGTFKAATEDKLKGRVFKVAKRRTRPSETTDTSSSGQGVFASFGGFKPESTTTSSVNTNKLFGFLGAAKNCDSSLTTLTKKGDPLIKSAVTGEAKANKQSVMQSPEEELYLSKLQELNRDVSDWIKTHVDSNPFCILTPVFSDYEKHLKQIQEERNAKGKSTPVSSVPASLSSFSFVSSSTSGTNFTINTPTPPSSTPLTADSKAISNDLLTQDNKPQPTPYFSFGSSDTTKSNYFTKPDPAALMKNPFTSSVKKDDSEEKPFSFSNGSAPTSSTNNKDENEEEEDSEEPPKVEFTPIQEENAVFTKTCRVFVKKEGKYTDRGKGTLYIKKVGENKHQLLVRAETVLGNILLNVLLSSSIPTQRTGKNNVVMVCLPTPQELPPPTTVLLRVKTESEADDLMATIDKYKN